MLTLAVVITVCLFSEDILYFFGEKYIEGKQALLILMVGQLLASLSCCDIFEYDGKAKYFPSRLDFCSTQFTSKY
jgi:hypothetical protein